MGRVRWVKNEAKDYDRILLYCISEVGVGLMKSERWPVVDDDKDAVGLLSIIHELTMKHNKQVTRPIATRTATMALKERATPLATEVGQMTSHWGRTQRPGCVTASNSKPGETLTGTKTSLAN